MSIPIIRCVACDAPMRRGAARCPKCRYPVGESPPSSRPPEPEPTSLPSQPIEPVRFCEHCGEALPAAARFCPHCGTAQTSDAPGGMTAVPEPRMSDEWTTGAGRVGSSAVATPGERILLRILLLLGLLGWLGGVLYAAPIALFGGVFPMYLWQTSRSGSVRAAAGSLVISCIVAALINWFFLGGVGVIAVWRDVMG